MRRRASNRLWTFILMLLLFGTSAASLPGIVRADFVPGDPVPGAPPDPQAGDPDWPAGVARNPKPGSTRGAYQSGTPRDIMSVRHGRLSVWFKFRMAFAATFRAFFRF